MAAIVLGVLAGISIVAGRMVNARLSAKLGPYRGAFYNYVTGLIFSLLLLAVSGEAVPAFFLPEGLRRYAMYAGGLVGVIVVSVSNIITPRMSAFLLTLLIFVSQLVSGVAIDALGGAPVSAGKLLGGVLVLLGVLYNQSLGRTKKDSAA
ncbi:MAG: DMT family transporter [Eubacteriales bacterium]|nr:DMT family transporter [Eubacteriales bacterium]